MFIRKRSNRPPKVKLIKVKDGYELSRVMYWFKSAFEYFITLLSSGAFLAKLTGEVGISDSVTAILTALTSFAGISQLISIKLANKRRVKGTVMVILLISQLIFSGMYLIPFLPIGKAGLTAIFFAAILAARVFAILPNPLQVTWYMNLVPMKSRGMYTAINQIVSLASGALVSFVAGSVIDEFAKKNDMQSAFIVLTVVIFAFTVLHLITLLLSKEKPCEQTRKNSTSLISSIKVLMKNKLYVKLMAVLLLEAIGSAVITPFLGTYQTRELGFTMTFISVITIIISVVGMASNFVFGRISQLTEYRSILKFSYPILFLAYLINIFTVPENGAALFIIYSVVLRIGTSATAVSQTNLLLQISTREQQTAAISVFSVVSGLLSFGVTLAISPFVDFMQANGNVLLGKTVYAQQLLSALSACFYLAGALVYFFIFLPSVDGRKRKAKEERTLSFKE